MKPSIYQRICLLLVLYFTASNICPVSGKKNFQCACGETDLGERILGGKKAGLNEFPWQALILFRNSLLCGGTVINDRYVLTAAHCVQKREKSSLNVILGAYRSSRRNRKREKRFSVTAKKVHKRYVLHRSPPFYLAQDIALLRLNETIHFNSYIRPVCLPRQGAKYGNKNATASGWGNTKWRGKLSNPLLKTVMRVMPDGECLLGLSGRHVAGDPSSMLCAYGGKRGICQGDSGGPLQYMAPNGKTIQIGIASFRNMCGVVGYPDIYTKVSTYSNWIRSNTKDANYCRH